jgi:hypothetical protein
MTSMNTRLAFVACVALITTTAHAEPALAYPKGREQCVRGYTQSGSFCTPKTGVTVRPAVPRVGSCPSGWVASGGACEKMR